jgi:hypothetical protein
MDDNLNIFHFRFMVGVHTSGMFALSIWFQMYILLNNSCMNSIVGIGGVSNKRIVGG